MEAEDPLSELADIHLPDAVSAWPPAPGWWVIAALAIFALALLYRHQLARLFVRRRLGVALSELERVYQTWRTLSQSEGMRNQAGLDLLYGFNAVLKRVALVYYPDTDVPRLIGKTWLQFLDRTGGTDAFTAGAGQALADGTYRPVFNADVEGLHALCRQWIAQRYLKPERKTKNASGKKPADQSGSGAKA